MNCPGHEKSCGRESAPNGETSCLVRHTWLCVNLASNWIGYGFYDTQLRNSLEPHPILQDTIYSNSRKRLAR